ncbi:MAG: hypothetical protein U0172_04205 [Nitrospiraceae bacterium]
MSTGTTSTLISLLFLASLLGGCTLSKSGYLERSVGTATEQEVQDTLGQPDQRVMTDAGQSRWIYRSCWIPIGCNGWYLTFDRSHTLSEWERAPEHL